MRTDSSLFEQFTLGIQEEFQIVDPNTASALGNVPREVIPVSKHSELEPLLAS